MLMTKSLLAFLVAVCFSVVLINAYRQPLRPRKQQRYYNNAVYNKKEGASTKKNGPMKYYGKQKYFQWNRFHFGSGKYNVDKFSVAHQSTAKAAANNHKQNGFIRGYRKKATNKKNMAARSAPSKVRNKKKWKKNVKNATKSNKLAPKNRKNQRMKYTTKQPVKYAANQRVSKATELKRLTRKKFFKKNRQKTTVTAITFTTTVAVTSAVLPESTISITSQLEDSYSFDDFTTSAGLNDDYPEIKEQTTTERTDNFDGHENSDTDSINEHDDDGTSATTAATSCPQSLGRSILKILCDSSMRPLIRAPFHLVGLLGKTSTTATTMNSEVNTENSNEDSSNHKDSQDWDNNDFVRNEKYESVPTNLTTETVDSVTASDDSVTTKVAPCDSLDNVKGDREFITHLSTNRTEQEAMENMLLLHSVFSQENCSNSIVLAEPRNEELVNVEVEITTSSPSRLADDAQTHFIIPNKYADSHSLHNYYCFPP